VSRINKIAGSRVASAVPPPASQIYKVVKIIDGREVVVYTDRKRQ
jgi:hypothetical protein